MPKYPTTGHLTPLDHLCEEVSAKFLYCSVLAFPPHFVVPKYFVGKYSETR